MKTTTITLEEFNDDQFKRPSNFYIRIATGDSYFIHTRDRMAAQKLVDDEFGKGRYKVNASKMSKAPESQSAVGRINSKSRSGMRKT